MTFLKSTIAAAVLALGAQAAQAATFTFNFGEAPGTHFVNGALTLDVSAQTFTTDVSKTVSSAGTVTNSGGGLGEAYNNTANSDGRVDSWDASPASASKREMLNFQFSDIVKLVSVTFASTVGGSEALFFLNNTVFSPATHIGVADGANSFASYGFTNSLIGIGARSNSAFYISSVTVETISAVPLPAGGLLLGSLVLVPFLRRKRRA